MNLWEGFLTATTGQLSDPPFSYRYSDRVQHLQSCEFPYCHDIRENGWGQILGSIHKLPSTGETQSTFTATRLQHITEKYRATCPASTTLRVAIFRIFSVYHLAVKKQQAYSIPRFANWMPAADNFEIPDKEPWRL